VVIQYRDSIPIAIRNAKLVVPIISPGWVHSGECQWEYNYAIRRNLTRKTPYILPVIIDPAVWDNLSDPKYATLEVGLANRVILSCDGTDKSIQDVAIQKQLTGGNTVKIVPVVSATVVTSEVTSDLAISQSADNIDGVYDEINCGRVHGFVISTKGNVITIHTAIDNPYWLYASGLISEDGKSCSFTFINKYPHNNGRPSKSGPCSITRNGKSVTITGLGQHLDSTC
jgi:hypothetical protein